MLIIKLKKRQFPNYIVERIMALCKPLYLIKFCHSTSVASLETLFAVKLRLRLVELIIELCPSWVKKSMEFIKYFQLIFFCNSFNVLKGLKIASIYIIFSLLKDELLNSGVWRAMNVMSKFDGIICVAVVPRSQ